MTEKKALTPREPWWGEDVSAAVYGDMSTAFAQRIDSNVVAKELATIAQIRGLQNSVNLDYCDRYVVIADAAQPDIKADFDKAHALLVNFGFAFLALVAGWILGKIF